MPDPGIVPRCLLGCSVGFVLGMLLLSNGGEQQTTVHESAVDMPALASKAFVQPTRAFMRPTLSMARPYEAANACRLPSFSGFQQHRARFGRPMLINAISAGDKLPSVELDEGFPPSKVNIAEYSKGKKIVVVGLPGAFTPT